MRRRVYIPKSANRKDEYIGSKTGAKRYHMSPTTFAKIATEAGALLIIRGKRVVNVRILDEYIESFPYFV